MEEKKTPIQKNDNKTLKEAGTKDLLTAVLHSAGYTLSKHEKTILEEFLMHGKTFGEVKDTRWWPISLQKRHYKNGMNKLINHLQQTVGKLSEYKSDYIQVQKKADKLQAELANANWELEKLRNMLKAKRKLKPEIRAFLSTLMDELPISARIKNACRSFGVYTVNDLVRVKKHEFLVKRNLGKKSAEEIEVFLKQYGLSWNMDI